MGYNRDGVSCMNLLGNSSRIQVIFVFVVTWGIPLTQWSHVFRKKWCYSSIESHIFCTHLLSSVGHRKQKYWKCVSFTMERRCREHDFFYLSQVLWQRQQGSLFTFKETMVELSRKNHFVSHFFSESNYCAALVYEQMPGYKFHIKCGLRFGWGIEGDIRPNAKIDILGLNIMVVIVLGSGLAQSVELAGATSRAWMWTQVRLLGRKQLGLWSCVIAYQVWLPSNLGYMTHSSSHNHPNFPKRGGELQLEIWLDGALKR
jgi:hypothetical protein